MELHGSAVSSRQSEELSVVNLGVEIPSMAQTQKRVLRNSN